MKTGIIYLVKNNINSKIYIGQTIQTLIKRKYSHLYNSKCSIGNMPFHAAIRKYGEDSFTWSILWQGDITLLNDKEIYFISMYTSNNSKFGYNVLEGGNFRFCKLSNLYSFTHISGIKEIDISIPDLCIKYNLKNSTVYLVVKNKRNSYKGWKVVNSLYDKYRDSLYSFIHSSGSIETSVTRNYMISKYGINKGNLSSLINNKLNKVKGWKLT